MDSPPTSSRRPQDFLQKWWSRILLAGFIAMTLYVIFGKEGGIIRVMELKSENDLLQKELQILQDDKEELEDQIQRLKDKDPVVIEEEARRKGMVMEGETVYRIRYKEAPDTSGTTEKRSDREGER